MRRLFWPGVEPGVTWCFNERHDWEQRQAPFLAAVWDRWWPGAIRRPVTNLTAQRAGVDAFLIHGAAQIPVEEKVRDRDYGDVLLELVSNDRTGAPGWAVKGARSRLLLYAIRSTGRGWVFPMKTVQLVSRARAEEWTRCFDTRVAKNPGYSSVNVPVPFDVFVAAIDEAHGLIFCSSCRMVCEWSDLRGPRNCSSCSPATSFEIKLEAA